ncbi:hypothetical protein BRADI_3g31860v3 [Brachypodium distachyon]|uniref:glutathione transferase n=1 Tax=Brachypodium distachyon TaxID=15368 RepID=A0A0Q3JH83_BRADI|nr:hypothetical protein BRADI_3g31860v3 [Brachypodium distachyon]
MEKEPKGDDGGDLKLLGLTVSPFVIRMKAVSYRYIEQDLFIKSDLLVTSNPVHKKVPVLIHGGRPVCESSAIMEYVDEVWAASTTGASILPADPYERATARFWAAYADSKLLPAWVGIMWAATEEERTEKVDETLAAIGRLEEAFGECSNGKAFFAGDSVGYLDLVLGSQLLWFGVLRKMFGVVVIDDDAGSKTPLLASWAKQFVETDMAKEVVPDVDTAVEYLKKLQAHRPGSTVTQLLS